MLLYLRELKYYLKSFFIWGLCAVFLILISSMVYTYIFKGVEEITTYLTLLPEVVHLLLGIAPPVDLSSVAGMFSFLFIYLSYILVFQAGFMGSRMISHEQEENTIDFLYTMPASRGYIMMIKLLAALTVCLALNLLTAAALHLLFETGGVSRIVNNYLLTNLLLQWLFLGLGALLASLTRSADLASTFIGLLTFAMLVLGKVLDLGGNSSALWLLSPFQYFPPVSYAYGGGYATAALLLTIVLILVSHALVLLLHLRKDFRLHR